MQNKVYVINKHGRPLMPCSPAKARHLLDDGKAKVKKRTPFTIQLLFGSTGYTQEVILGVDAGSKTIGLSASTETEELFSAEVKPRNDVVDLLSTRREFRRARRNRKTRYRKPRFDNRVRSKHKGWLAPSVEVKIQEHMTAIRRICRILPVSKVVVETAEFDLQLIKAVEEGKPVPQGEDYQKGEMYGHYNVRQYVLWRDGYTCQCCGAHATQKKEVRLHVHHLESRKIGGDAPSNLIALCESCHEKFHKGIITTADFKKRKRKSTRDATFMGIMRKTLIQRLRAELTIPVIETRGYTQRQPEKSCWFCPRATPMMLWQSRRDHRGSILDTFQASGKQPTFIPSGPCDIIIASCIGQPSSREACEKLIRQRSMSTASASTTRCFITVLSVLFGAGGPVALSCCESLIEQRSRMA